MCKKFDIVYFLSMNMPVFVQVTCAPAPAHASLQLVLEVQVSTSGESVSHMSSSGSRLAVTDLHSGATYTLVLWNTNRCSMICSRQCRGAQVLSGNILIIC